VLRTETPAVCVNLRIGKNNAHGNSRFEKKIKDTATQGSALTGTDNSRFGEKYTATQGSRSGTQGLGEKYTRVTQGSEA